MKNNSFEKAFKFDVENALNAAKTARGAVVTAWHLLQDANTTTAAAVGTLTDDETREITLTMCENQPRIKVGTDAARCYQFAKNTAPFYFSIAADAALSIQLIASNGKVIATITDKNDQKSPVKVGNNTEYYTRCVSASEKTKVFEFVREITDKNDNISTSYCCPRANFTPRVALLYGFRNWLPKARKNAAAAIACINTLTEMQELAARAEDAKQSAAKFEEMIRNAAAEGITLDELSAKIEREQQQAAKEK